MRFHISGCKCERCARMFAAILATNPDGSPFFTDQELESLSREDGDNGPDVWVSE